MGLAVVMLIGLPINWRLASVAHRLRRQSDIAASPDGYTIPPAAALEILGELRTALPGQTEPKLLAQMVGSVFETLNAHPPGVLASLGLLAVHGMSFLASIVLAVIFVLGQRGDFWETADLLANKPTHVYAPGDTLAWRGPDAPATLTDARTTIIATFDGSAAAKAAFEALPAELPRHSLLRWFGESVLLTLPTDHEPERNFWTDRLRPQSNEVLVDRKRSTVLIRLFCIAANSEEAESLEAELRGYLNAPNGRLLLAPWTAGWQALPQKQRQEFQKARLTLQRLQRLRDEATEHPEIRARQNGLADIVRGGDMQKLTEASKSLDLAIKAQERRLLEAIRASGDPAMDLRIVTHWEELRKLDVVERLDDDGNKMGGPDETGNQPAQPPDAKAFLARFKEQEKIREDIYKRMAVRMGAVPAVKDQEDSPDDLQGVQHGGVRRHGLYLSFEYLAFRHPDHGLPALAAWLHERGMTEIRYGFVPPFVPGDAAPDDTQR